MLDDAHDTLFTRFERASRSSEKEVSTVGGRGFPVPCWMMMHVRIIERLVLSRYNENKKKRSEYLVVFFTIKD